MRCRRHTVSLALAALVLNGCGPEQAPRGKELALVPVVADLSEVVARVNDRPISALDLQVQMQNGKSRNQALQQLVEMELLAQEAARRGIHRQPAIGKLQRRAMANRLIRRDFGDKFTRASVPDDLIDITYKRMMGYFVHPEDVSVWHFVVLARKRRTSKETQQRATALCNEIHRRATRKPLTLVQFKALQADLPPVKPPIKVDVQSFITGEKGPAVPAFARAAFALQRKGQISSVVETLYGCHVIYLLERRPAKNISRSQAEPEIRDKIFTKAREKMFSRWAAKIEAGYTISVFPEVLDRAHKKPPIKAQNR